MISLDDIHHAAARIESHVRRTPLLRLSPTRSPAPLPRQTYLKLECLQVTGSFKPRGGFNRSLMEPRESLRGLVTSSGGNHGIAMAHVGRELGVPVVVPLFAGVSEEKISRMRSLGAQAQIVGPNFQVSNNEAMHIAAERGFLYVHPFADPAIIAGQGTIGSEILADLPEADLVLVAVGGGGLLGGIAIAIKEQRPNARIIGVEPTGADALRRSLEANRLIRLEHISTKAATLAPPFTEQINLDLARRYVDDVITVTDEEMQLAAHWLWQEHSIATELAGAATTAALLSGKVTANDAARVVGVVCGSGSAGWTD